MNCIDPAVNANEYIFTKEAWALYHTIHASDLGSFWAYFMENEYIKKNELVYAGNISNWFTTMDMQPSLKLKFDVSDILLQLQDAPDELVVSNFFKTPSQVYFQNQVIETDFDLEFADYVYSHVEDYVSDLLKCYEYSHDKSLSQIFSKFIMKFEREWWMYENIVERDLYKSLLTKYTVFI